MFLYSTSGGRSSKIEVLLAIRQKVERQWGWLSTLTQVQVTLINQQKPITVGRLNKHYRDPLHLVMT